MEFGYDKYAVPGEKNAGCYYCSAPIAAGQGFCSVCGRPSAEGDEIMLYQSIAVDKNGRALVCPYCDNEELPDGDFCMVCGSNIVNCCADSPDRGVDSITLQGCGAILPGNARYCPKCGNESSFFQHGWLRDWRSENTKKAIKNANVTPIDLYDNREEKAK